MFDDEAALGSALDGFIEENRQRLGLVSLDAPLISNLDVSINIALIKQYHHNLHKDEAERIVIHYLRRYGMEKIARQRNALLTERERFCVMLLRAAMVSDAVIAIDRPFKMVPDLQNARFIYDALKSIDDSFTECHIFDYSWDEDRYRMTDD